MGINPRASGKATTKEGKTLIVERTKKLIDESQLIISVPSSGITKEQIDSLRKELPKTARASVVKNKLMKVALEGTSFEALGDTITNENMFFFIPEGEARKTFEEFKKWQKETKRDDQGAKHAVMEGKLYSSKEIEGLTKLPTKLELITKVAIAIKAVPTKVGRGVNAVPNKLGRAFAQLKNMKEEEEKEA